ncbi:hypothetical protein AMJ44_09540 [candidate division WOR-1 bacterium DG_54_3]|uniref:Uncharacterized protein n=1 Tax=candidate division WOR-1 bacterium DG_54_3 TaxID=1703775 RepID=A0A0S7XTD3_UNCSA|nr:MAG: hypothetical protein AMJ44_09540 [candidate division WOR-1 bacterium DG_54_3]
MSFSKLFQNGRFLPSFFFFLFVVCIFSQAQADVPDMMINTDGTTQIHNEEQIWVSPIDSTVVMIVFFALATDELGWASPVMKGIPGVTVFYQAVPSHTIPTLAYLAIG